MSQEFSYEEDYAALKSFGDPVTLEAYTAFKMNNLRLEQDDLTKAKLQDISEDFKSIDQDEDQAISLEEYEVNPLRVESAILQVSSLVLECFMFIYLYRISVGLCRLPNPWRSNQISTVMSLRLTTNSTMMMKPSQMLMYQLSLSAQWSARRRWPFCRLVLTMASQDGVLILCVFNVL